jgi:CBS domain-containing protein
MKNTTIKHYVTLSPVVISPDSTVEEAAAKMEKFDCGIFPVGTADKAIGMITDRDIVVRAIAKKKHPASTKVSEIMTKEVYSIPEDTSVHHAADVMRKHQVNRLLVNDARGVVIGILSLGHLIRNADPELVAKVVMHSMGKKAA